MPQKKDPDKKIDAPGGPPAAKAGDPKKYDDVIPKTAKSYPGVFTVHRVDEKIYFEIPKDAFNKLMLWQAEVAQGARRRHYGGFSLGHASPLGPPRQQGLSLAGGFPQKGEGHLRPPSIRQHGHHHLQLQRGGRGQGSLAVIHATPLYMTDLLDLSVKGGGLRRRHRRNRSYLEEVKAFPTNIEVRSLLTFTGGGGGGADPPGSARAARWRRGQQLTAVVHYSLDDASRKSDDGPVLRSARRLLHRRSRITSPKTWMDQQQYIARFRLEKKDPSADVSDPVKPIVFYLAKEVPEKWRSYLKKGVEDWKPAFEKAGFKNAIVCQGCPDREPRTRPGTRKMRAIRSFAGSPNRSPNAMGPHVHDPRSGEIISAHIIFWHDVAEAAQEWYFVQCCGSGPAGPQAAAARRSHRRIAPLHLLPRSRATRWACATTTAPARPIPSSSCAIRSIHRQARQRRLDHVVWPIQLRRPARGQGQEPDSGDRSL